MVAMQLAFALSSLVLHSCALTLERQAPAAEKRYPITRVVDLLKEMKEQLEKEQDEDESVYEKLACWCETNDKGKTQAIADGDAKISQLSSKIETTTAKSQSLSVEIEALEKEVAGNEKSLAAATALREKQAAEFTAEEKEMMQSISALDAAVTVLSKHHGGAAFLDERLADGAGVSAEATAAAATALKAMNRFSHLLRGTLSPKQRRALQAFAQQAPTDYFSASPTFKQAYAPQSGEIFGILRQMKETFEADLSDSQKEEIEAQKAYKALKAAKEQEIATGKASLQEKSQQLAAADEALVQAKEERKDTEETLSADKAFLSDLKVKCALTDKEWQARQQTRQSELAAVAEAISILSSDDARDLASRTFNPASLLQTSRRHSSGGGGRQRAAAALRSVAIAAGDPRIAMLANRVQLDAFVQVKKAIDDMVAELLREADDEVKFRDYCVDELAKNDRATSKEVHTKAKVESDIEGLTTLIQGLNSTIATLESDIADLKTQRQRAKEDRDAAHKDFETTVADQRETQAMLQKAIDVLGSIYAPKSASLAQQRQAPPKDFKAYEKQSERSSGILALLAHILEEAKSLEAEALHAEEQSVTSYQNLVQEIADSVAAKEQSIVDRSSERAQAKEDLTNKKVELRGSLSELEALASTLAGLHGNCDFFLKNNEARAQARTEEIEALRQAKAFLSGME